MSPLPDTWESLEEAASGGRMAWRRLHADSPHDLRLVVDGAGATRSMTFTRPWAKGQPSPRVTRTRSITMENHVSESVPATATTTLTLVEASYTDVFDALVSDVSASIAASADVAAALDALEGRLEHWQELLAAIGPEGLDARARRGLFGELTVMRHLLLDTLGAHRTVEAWTGPLAANQDFQTDRCAVEVKTTMAKQPTGFTVANERELDPTGTGRLMVVHLSLDERRGGTGQTLADAVDDLLEALAPAAAARALLADRLVRMGYLAAHRSVYDEPRYSVRDRAIFDVGPGFPRIVEGDLRPGVGDVQYTVGLAACRPHFVEDAELRAALTGEGA